MRRQNTFKKKKRKKEDKERRGGEGRGGEEPRNTELLVYRGPKKLRKLFLLTTAETVRPEPPSFRRVLGLGSLTLWWYFPVSKAAISWAEAN